MELPPQPITTGQPVAAKAFRVDESTLKDLYGADDDDAWFAEENFAAPEARSAAEDEWDEPPVFHPLVEDDEEEAEEREPAAAPTYGTVDSSEENIFAAAYSANLRRAQRPAKQEKPAPEAAPSTSESLYTVSYLAPPKKPAAPAPKAEKPQPAPASAASGLLKTAPLRVPGSRPASQPNNPSQGGDAK